MGTALIPLPLSTAVESAPQPQIRHDFFKVEHVWNCDMDGWEQRLCGTCAIGGALTVACPDLEEIFEDTLMTIEMEGLGDLLPVLDRMVPLDLVPSDVRRQMESHPYYRKHGVEIGSVIANLNDDACWTRKQIAAWLRSMGF